MIRRLYNRLFVCPKVGHSPGTRGYKSLVMNDHCMKCGGYAYVRGKWPR